MGIWDTLKTHAKAQFLDVIQWLDETQDTIVYRFPIFNQAIQDGGKLVVRESQAAVFVSEGQLSNVFTPGTYELSSRTKAIWSFFESIKYQLNYPYKGDIYFVSTKQFTNQKWGTPNPIMMRDAHLGPVRIRAFGSYAFRVSDPAIFLREIVGTNGLFTTEEVNGHVKRKLVSAFADTLGESKIPVLDLAAQYMDIGDALRQRMTGWFEQNFGIALTDFVVENVSLPPEVEKMLDKRTSMGIIGDMGAFTQFQAANAIESMASRPGASNPMMDAGMGMAMGGAMGAQLARGPGAVFDPQTGMGGAGAAAPPGPPAPPPPPVAARFHYHGPSGQGEYGAQEIAALIAKDRKGAHNVWAAGWAGWKPWSQVPEIAGLVPPEMPPPPAMNLSFHYNGPSGQAELSLADIVRQLQSAPQGRHLVWRTGFDGWKDARDVPEIAAAMSAGGPPPPPAPPPPPIG